MKNNMLLWITTLAIVLTITGSGCSVFQEMNGSDQKSIEKAKEKEKKAEEAKKEESHVPPEVASGLNDVEKQELEAIYKKNNSDSKAVSKRVFGGFLPGN